MKLTQQELQALAKEAIDLSKKLGIPMKKKRKKQSNTLQRIK